MIPFTRDPCGGVKSRAGASATRPDWSTSLRLLVRKTRSFRGPRVRTGNVAVDELAIGIVEHRTFPHQSHPTSFFNDIAIPSTQCGSAARTRVARLGRPLVGWHCNSEPTWAV